MADQTMGGAARPDPGEPAVELPEPDPETDADAFAEKDPVNDPEQDRDDADPTAPEKPPFEDDLTGGSDQVEERRREIEGNRGPDEEPGFGQGA